MYSCKILIQRIGYILSVVKLLSFDHQFFNFTDVMFTWEDLPKRIPKRFGSSTIFFKLSIEVYLSCFLTYKIISSKTDIFQTKAKDFDNKHVILSITCRRDSLCYRLASRSNGSGLIPGRGHCVVFTGHTLYSHRGSLHPDV